MNITAYCKRLVVALPMTLALLASAHAAKDSEESRIVPVQINQARGSDAAVNYAELSEHGPWDDRNYALTAADVALLDRADRKLSEPIPAFFRVLLRKEMARDQSTGQRGKFEFLYPRSGLNRFLQAYGGYQINGITYTNLRRVDDGRYEVLAGDAGGAGEAQELPNYTGGEKRMTSPSPMSESAIAIHPTDTRFVIAGTNGGGGGQRMWRSSDSGLTWQSSGSLPETCCDPTVGWSPDGSVAYTASLAFSGTAGCVRVYRSTDKGATWTNTAGLTTASCDKEYMHIDMHASSPRKGNIYVSWHESNTQYFAASSNGGTSFTAKKSLDTANRGIGSDLTTDTAGNVYFFYPTTSGTNRKTVRMIKSADGGTTFGTPVSVHVNNAEYDFPVPAMESRRVFIYVGADSDRTNGTFKDSIYAAWTDTNGGDSDTASANHAIIKVGRSRDGGATWTVNSPHPTSDSATVDRFHPWISVDNQGRVHVIYYDTRHSSNRSGTDIYHSVSTDGGVTWGTPTRKTTVTSSNIGEANEWGDYNGLDSIGADIIAVYTDNRNESGGTAESVDVYSIGFATTTGGNQAPVANFNFTTSSLTASFTDSSTDSDGSIASRAWNFGDGTTSTATNPSKTYSAAGTYTVTLTVTDNAGATNTTSRTVTVSTTSNAAPVANFSVVTSGLTATFTDSSTDSDGTIASRAWNFGDSTTSSATNPSKTYAAAGTYTVTLTVTDNGGASNTKTSNVTVGSVGNVLQNGVPVTGLAAATGANLSYTINVPAGASNLNISTSGGTGDADLYVKFGTAPTTSVYDCRPYKSGNAESCAFATPQAGTYHIMLRGYAAFSGVTLTGSYSTVSGGPFFENTADFSITDNATIESPINVTGVAGNAPAALKVGVTINHTYQGDLKVDLVAPNGTVFTLWNRTGGGTDNIIQTFTVNASAVVANGGWKLRVNDNANGDIGTLDKWSLQF